MKAIMEQSAQITVLGRTFSLKGGFDAAYITRVEGYLQAKIDEVRAVGGTVDSYDLMILVALNLVDDCLKRHDEMESMAEGVNKNVEELINLIDSRM
jgi:cell division protein ZapA (FtsZ GTPase activity inhibitor)